MPLVSLQHADLLPNEATALANRLVELAAQAEEGQVLGVHITRGGAVGMDRYLVAAELREEDEEQ